MSNISSFQFEEMVRRLNRQQGTTPEPEQENDLHRDIMEHCNGQWPRWKYVHSRMDKATRNALGVPDFIIALPGGITLYLEVKRRGGKVSPAQASWISEMTKIGHTVYVVYTFQEFLQIVSKHTDHQPPHENKIPRP